jgi:membrane fusion protein (multidrug efflux system)
VIAGIRSVSQLWLRFRVVAARRRCRAGALVLAVLLGGGACEEAPTQGERANPPPVSVQLFTVASIDLPHTLSAVGSLAGPEMATLASEISGRVVRLDIPEGQRVERGHLLARLDDTEARAAVAVTRARLKKARDHLERLESLRAESVSSEQAYEDASSEFEAARGAFEEAESRLAKTAIRAPFAGALGLRQLNVGQYVGPGTPVVEITQIDPLELVFSLPQRDRRELAPQQEVIGIVGRCGPRFEGRVVAIDPRVDPATRSVQLRARVPNSEGALHPGMAVRVRLVVGESPGALVVPQEAIVRQGTKHVVYVVDDAGLAQPHEVDLGQFFVDGVQVRSGIAAGARIVVAGQQKLRPGSPIREVPYQPTRNPNLELGRFGPLADCRTEP